MNSFFKNLGPFALKDICTILNMPLPEGADEASLIQQAKPLSLASEEDISFLFNKKYLSDLETTKAGFCLVEEAYAKHVPAGTVALITSQPYRDWALVLKHFYQDATRAEGISPFAKIHPSARLGDNISIGAFSTIGAYAIIGHNTVIDDHVVIQKNVEIGDNCHIESHTTLSHCHIGHHVHIKPGSRIGQSGFGFHMDEKGPIDVLQLGIVCIGDGTEIGANVCIDRGSMHNTVIGKGVRIDNLVQIAHNVEVGDYSVLVAQVGVAGSTKLGQYVIAAGQVGIAGHLDIGDGVKIAAQSGLMRSVEAGQTVGGSPAMPVRDWHRQTIILNQLVRDRKA